MLRRNCLLLLINVAVLMATTPLLAMNPPGHFQGKKVLWVDSYHQGYVWSDGLERDLRGVLQKTGVQFQIFRMDTKRNDSGEYGKKSGLAALKVVE